MRPLVHASEVRVRWAAPRSASDGGLGRGRGGGRADPRTGRPGLQFLRNDHGGSADRCALPVHPGTHCHRCLPETLKSDALRNLLSQLDSELDHKTELSIIAVLWSPPIQLALIHIHAARASSRHTYHIFLDFFVKFHPGHLSHLFDGEFSPADCLCLAVVFVLHS